MSDSMQQHVIHERIVDILMVLSDVAAGDYSARVEADLPEDHPFGALARAVNEMIASLGATAEEGARYAKELEMKVATIEAQSDAIRELSTPLIEVWDGVLCLPIVGVVDTQRSAEMTESLLRTVTERQVRFAIIDVTGIEVMDTRTTDHFIRMTRAVMLLGSECVITGINPQIAQTIVHMGVNLEGITTFRTLRDALRSFVTRRSAAQQPARRR